jgi:DNA-binding SARP family transcriptional activator
MLNIGSSAPRLELRTLGVSDLRGPADADCQAVLQQPKRLALLAYLATSSPRRFHRRDSLLAMFWPDLDQDRSRAALRRSLYFIRTALGPDVIAGRGEEEVGVEAAALWCDATAFEQAMDAGDLSTALGLYQGELLSGMYVAGAPEFERWLERERTRLRERASAAAWSLAEAAATGGNNIEGARLARRAATLTPDDEAALRRLMLLLDRLGDRAGALRAFDEFARRMAEEYEMHPSAETADLAEEIRSRPAAPRRRPTEVAPDTIAVFPFSIRGAPALSYLGEGMVDLLATALDGAGNVRTVDPRAMLGYLGREGWRPDDPTFAAAVAAHFGAGLFVLGSVTGVGGQLHAVASLYSDPGTIGATARATADGETELFELVDTLVRQLLAGHSAGPGARLNRLAALTTSSLPALKAYLNGEAALRSGRYFDAMEALQRAVSADGSFGLAYYRLASAAAGSAMPELARQISNDAHRHRERLTGHDRLLLDAQRAWLNGAVAEAEAHYGTITGTYPDEVEAWFLLGDLLFHSNPLRGRSATESREPFERALELEPDHASSLVHLTRVAAIEGRREEAEHLAARAILVSPAGDQVLSLRALLAWMRGDTVEQAAVADELQRSRALTVAVAFSDVALYSGSLAGADAIARGFIQAARSDEMRALCHLLLAHVALARDDQRSAWAELDRAQELNHAHGLATRGLFAALPFVVLSTTQIAATRDALAAWDPASVPRSDFLIFAMHNGLHPHIRLYLLALLDAKLGDTAAAETWAGRLAALPAGADGAALAAHLSRGANAAVAAARGDTLSALNELEGGRSESWFQLTVASPFYSQAYERFLRAGLLAKLGRTREAAGWYGSMAERSPYEIIYRAPAQIEMAKQ